MKRPAMNKKIFWAIIVLVFRLSAMEEEVISGKIEPLFGDQFLQILNLDIPKTEDEYLSELKNLQGDKNAKKRTSKIKELVETRKVAPTTILNFIIAQHASNKENLFKEDQNIIELMNMGGEYTKGVHSQPQYVYNFIMRCTNKVRQKATNPLCGKFTLKKKIKKK